MIKKLLVLIALLLLVGIASYGYSYYENNKTREWPARSELQAAFDRSVGWLENNNQSIQNSHNVALWWILKEASDVNQDDRISAIYQQYKTTVLDINPANIWTPYFRKHYKPAVPDIVLLHDFKPYQKFLVYALSCDKDLARAPVIQAQHEANFCPMHYLNTHCVTHQLMAVSLMQERYCGNDQQLAALSRSLQEIIINELTYDFRVNDSYLQRVLMLAETGNFKAIKPVWVKRILDAQNDDGGWDDLHPVIPLGNLKFLGWSSRLMPVYREKKSNFHASAQGIWLLALLLAQQDKAE